MGHLPPGLEPSTGVDARVIANSHGLRKRLRRARFAASPVVRQAVETIEHFSLFVPMKMMHALSAVAAAGPGDQQSDANGSGKAALLGLERMSLAWQCLIDTRHCPAREAAPYLEEIARLQRNVLRAVPNARNFVRPGFDEIDVVNVMDAAERTH